MTEIIDGIAHLTAAEAAAELSTTETRVLMLLKQNVLQGTLSDQGWFITRASLDRFDRHSETARPPACLSACTASRCGCHQE
ncbi:hypothetical protein KP001_05120 [Geomonas subterranea]|uniref:Helix-turn-helix domain-containing protein n=1 Tax=Geomonas subterranea TaxID=2847989 RepID=A0ABX8LMR2_9BACT|nr:hypothetical protein [Geomonas subterranea]QXE91919.1 hypothetical protein KP001_05120 [Geomonas subterranea]QXM09990.1 hypothetical protein KP002_02375 [Geomonas subterranea]